MTTTSNTGPRRVLRHGKNGRRTCSSGSVSPSTNKEIYLQSSQIGHFIGLQSTSDRTEPEEDAPVYPTRADKFRVYRFPWRQGSLFPSNVRRTHTPPALLAGRGGALKLVRGDAAFLIMSLYLPPSPSNLREKQLSEKIWKWARRVLDVPVLLLDANGHISQNTWPEQIGKYSSKKTTYNGQCLGELLRDHHLQAANTFFPWERLSLDPSPLCVSSSCCSCSQMLTTEIDRKWQQPRGEGIIAPFSVSFNISLHTECMKKGKITNGKERAYTRCPFRAGTDHLSVTGRGSMPAR